MKQGLTALYLFAIIVIWGTNYPLMQIAFVDVAPLTFATFRFLGGAGCLFLLLYCGPRKDMLPPREELLKLGGISILQFVSVLGFAGIALLYLPAGRTVTIIYTMPFWVTVFSFLVAGLRPARTQIVGMLLSVGGLLLFLDPAVIDLDSYNALFGLGLALIAPVLWGLGAVLYKFGSWRSSILSQSFWQLLVAGLFLAVLAFLFERKAEVNFTLSLWFILIWNCIGPAAFSVWAWSEVLKRMPASTASQFTMFTPFVGIAASTLIFQETLPAMFAISVLFIASGGVLSLVNTKSSANRSE